MTLQQENNNLLKFILNERFFKPWKNQRFTEDVEEDRKKILNETHLELFLTSTCNQHCEYCYLVKNNEKLYPSSFNDKDLILKNLNILLEWFKQENMFIPTIELFSGEIWHTSYGLEVLEIILKHVKQGFQTNTIVIPSNCSFLRNEKQRNLIQRYINNFKKAGINLLFSISVDGKIIEDQSRPLNNLNDHKNDEFYEQMFLFAAHNNFCFHPMVSSNNVQYWIENFQWWEKNMEYYNIPFEALMMLEVRNDDWTAESIEYYNNFMDFLLDHWLSKNSVQRLARILSKGLTYNKQPLLGYTPFFIGETENYPACSIATHLTVRLGDLAICPCHRTCYDKYTYGYFNIENDKIVDILANNTAMAIRVLFSNNNLCSLKCDSCLFRDYCLKGCFGAQLETNKDPFIPIKSVCDFFEKKYVHLIQTYKKLGVLEILQETSPYEVNYIEAKKFLYFAERVLKEYGMGKN